MSKEKILKYKGKKYRLESSSEQDFAECLKCDLQNECGQNAHDLRNEEIIQKIDCMQGPHYFKEIKDEKS